VTLVHVDSEFNNCTFSFSHNKIYVFFAVPFFSSVLGHYYSILFSLGLLVSIVVALFLGVLSFSACIHGFSMASYDVPFIYGLFGFFTILILLRSRSAHAFCSFLVGIL